MNKPYLGKAGALLPAFIFFSPMAMSAAERQLDAHDHGHAQLNIALSNNDVLMELISPSANIVGFEHAPKTEDDHAVIDAAVAQLIKGDEIFITGDMAKCTLQTARAESPLITDDHDDDHHDEDHDKDHDDDHHDEDHDKDHDDDHHDEDHDKDHDDDHHDGEGHHDHDEETHSEFQVAWAFDCKTPAKLTSIDVKLFDFFTGFEEIDVSVVSDTGQSAHELTPDQTRINLQ